MTLTSTPVDNNERELQLCCLLF